QVIQSRFENIYRTCEKLEDIDHDIDEDRILNYHCVAFEEWSPYGLVKDFIKEKRVRASSQQSPSNVINWIIKFTIELKESFDIIYKILYNRDTLEAFADLCALNRLAPFYPLLIKTYKFDPGGIMFNRVTRLMEIFAFRGYAIGNLKSDAGIPEFYRMAKSF